ncbi:hypothetical protein GCM10009642_58130 [Nocardiopsis metallicus]
MIAASARTGASATPRIRGSAAPSSHTSRKTRESGPACGTIPEYHCSDPPREARHWKNMAPREPRATWDRLCRMISPGALATVRPGVYTTPAACSASSQGRPPPGTRAA